MYYPRLKDLREDADLNQEKAGEILGMTQQQYARYEKGIQEIPFRHVITLAKFYNISIDYIAGLIPKPRPL